ncbi:MULTISPECIES: NAD(P)/FAD-dependent oxidoreductase [unclassified Streptomyces]|uniref:NAD(P)/FAD-dependent oxidoreductase n=1 Tax=unclassified Streptomyces TaxID=2593676 RepID=UPI002DDAE824|nr:NAD(P)/FAD-dependent oxidoreductase [Streptomyces sp. NBC_01766]WSC25111.1 NAD(P)/FAD-dependent oxidoreductase [Streptomyces sp. NBC_01766]WSV59008.1 NAD(P)/FAD-dependent oxidoreductase [Streptomyces sp. NBC_01014]
MTTDAYDLDSTDVAVVGGGPAGLSAALQLARYGRRVLVFDTGQGRSTHHQTNRNYLGFPDGIATTELRALGRRQLAHYPHVCFAAHRVTGVLGDARRGFTVQAQGHVWRARTVVLATGVLDHFPHFPGWKTYVGRSMFWCIACDGYENRGRRILVVGHTDAAAGEAMQLHSLTERVQLLTNSRSNDISPRFGRRLGAAGVPIVHDRIKEAEGTDGQLSAIVTRAGERLLLDALFSIQGATPEVAVARGLGVRLNAQGYVDVDMEQHTSVPGVYAAGDITAPHSHQVSAAVQEGAQAASAANYFLYPPELRAD